MSVPLIQNNDKDSINTSIIAIKRSLERINTLLGLTDNGSEGQTDTSEFVKKSEVVDAVVSDNMNPVTSNAVATSNAMPVDTVTSGDMHSVTSNAVANSLNSHIGQNYCFIPNPNGSDRYTTVRFSKTNWGFTSNDLYGIVMTYYNGEDFYINARTGNAHSTDPFSNRTELAYLNGIYIDLDNGLLYIRHNGYRGFFIRFQGNLISVATSITAPTGITFNNIVFTRNN